LDGLEPPLLEMFFEFIIEVKVRQKSLGQGFSFFG
jgi:hypothetical protein